MESLSSNSEERELQHMKLEERQLHSNCMARFKELKTHLEYLHNINNLTGITMDDNLIAKESTNDSTSSEQQNKCSKSGNKNKSSDNESNSAGNNADADIEPSNDNDTILDVHHDMFENRIVHGIQNHVQPESIPDTYVMNENNSNIISCNTPKSVFKYYITIMP
ncbi:hypothetical protein Tco_1498506 [Tanacetum coccineum]